MNEPRLTPTRRQRLAGWVITVIAAIAIGTQTLYPVAAAPAMPVLCIFCGPLGGVDFALNVALFVPLGVGYALLGLSRKRAVLAGLLVTLFIEALQWRVIPGRDASLGDVLANLLGTLLGFSLPLILRRHALASGRASLPSLRFASVVVSLSIVGASFLLVPAPPSYEPWILWSVPPPGVAPFPGTMRRATVNGHEVAEGNRLNPDSVVRGSERLTRIEALGVGEFAVTRKKTLILTADAPPEGGFFLGQWQDALIFQTRTVASWFRLRPLLVRLPRAFPTHPRAADSVMRVEALSDRHTITLSIQLNDRAEAVVSRTVGLAWAFLLPWERAIDGSWWPVNLLFLAILVLPVGYLAARALHSGAPDEVSRAQALWPVLVTVTAFALAPHLAGISPSGVGEWVGVVIGIVAGLVTGRTAAASEP